MAAPLLAGLVANAVQRAGHRLGVINPALYRMHGAASGLADVTAGNTTTAAMRGYPARPGYDLATGLGTVTAAGPFITALARGSGHAG